MAEQSLKDKTVKGTVWTAIETILRYGVSFIVGIILARLLSPDEYGLIGILTIYIAIFEIIIDGGFSNALIRKQNASELDYNTVFYTNLVVSLLMAAMIFLSAGIIADFFYHQELLPLTQVMSIVVVLNALALVQKARLTKLIDFKTQTKVSVISAVSSGCVGIVMAYTGYGVWALVGQQLSNSAITTVLFWTVNRWTPRLQFSWISFREMWSFGWKLLLSGIFNTLSTQCYQAVVGKVFTPATLGQYTRANQFGQIISGNITGIVQRVSFPVLSAIQEDPERLKDAYKRLIKITVLPTFVFMLLLAACAKPLILVLIGEKWLDSALYLQLICFSMMLNPLQALNLSAIQVMGRSDLTLRINIIKNLLVIIPVALGVMCNFYWMLIADVIRNCLCYYLNAYYSKPLLHYPIGEQIRDVQPSFMLALVIAFPIYCVSFVSFSPLLLLFLQLILGSIICVIVLEKTKISEYMEIRRIFLSIISEKNRI